MSSQKTHRQEIAQRREKVASLLRDSTESEIAVILGVSRETIARDVAFLKKSVNGWLDELAKDGFIFECKLALERLRSNRKKYDELYEKSNDTMEKLSILKESRENEKLYLELLSEKGTLHAFRKAMEKTNVQTT